MADIRLIVADLDGTLLGKRTEQEDYESLLSKLDQLTDTGTVWVINTGRSVSSFRRVFARFLDMGIIPHRVIVNHAFVYSITKWGYLPHIFWNMQTSFRVMSAKFRARMLIRQFTKVIKAQFKRVRCLRVGRYRMAYRFTNDVHMNSACELLRGLASPYRNIFISEHMREVLVSIVPFTKGLAVDHIAKHFGIRRENILCIGNGQNDISMLDGTSAALTACPSNASADVMRTVHKSRGHIARKPTLAGTIESIEAHLTGTVNSELPQDILLQDEGSYSTIPDHHTHRHSDSSTARTAVLILICIVVVVLTLASCRLLGPLSNVLMRPVNRAAELVLRMF